MIDTKYNLYNTIVCMTCLLALLGAIYLTLGCIIGITFYKKQNPKDTNDYSLAYIISLFILIVPISAFIYSIHKFGIDFKFITLSLIIIDIILSLYKHITEYNNAIDLFKKINSLLKKLYKLFKIFLNKK